MSHHTWLLPWLLLMLRLGSVHQERAQSLPSGSQGFHREEYNYLSIDPCICPPMHLFIHPSIHPSTSPSPSQLASQPCLCYRPKLYEVAKQIPRVLPSKAHNSSLSSSTSLSPAWTLLIFHRCLDFTINLHLLLLLPGFPGQSVTSPSIQGPA
jgi:hypothetical protein